jgi:hypothetical protein
MPLKKPTRTQLSKAVESVREREREVALEVALGTRSQRNRMWWGCRQHTNVAHFFIEVEWQPIPGSHGVVVHSACGRWNIGRYADDKPPRRIDDLSTWRRVCQRCAYEVQQEDA